MKYIIIIALLFCSCNTDTEIKQAYNKGYKEGQFDEKHRWVDFELDSVKQPLIGIQIELLTGKISEKEAFNKSIDLIIKTTNPFFTANKK